MERPPCGHDTCDRCAELRDRRAALEAEAKDADVRAQLAVNDEDTRAHKAFNDREREEYTDAVALAEHRPSELTCLTIDAPTRHQFDVPSPRREPRGIRLRAWTTTTGGNQSSRACSTRASA
eukprot:6118405-Prymnesium_polylepis.1